MNLTTLRGDIGFWDRFAPWYEKWLSRGTYHQPIIREVTHMIEHGWRVLDIGAATGVLSLPMAAMGCSVQAVEPSEGMRRIFREKLAVLRADVKLVPDRWETYQPAAAGPPDLLVACNSLHLTEGGLMKGMQKAFSVGAGSVCLVTEINQDLFIDFKEIHALQDAYEFLFIRKVTVDSSFCFEEMDEAIELSETLRRRVQVTPAGGAVVERDRTDVAVVLWERK